MNTPPVKAKLFFWIILGSLSSFFAEVISGSFLFPFFEVWGVVVLIPWYSLHILVLAYIVYTFGKARFYALYVAGMIFGMYEAYATGVLWHGWGDGLAFSLFGLGVIETIMLVLVWHPLMAFILPVIIAEAFLTNSRDSLYDVRKLLTKRFMIVLAVVFGFVQALNIPVPQVSLPADSRDNILL